jgi:ABC-2 type transport system ATP-binding protein
MLVIQNASKSYDKKKKALNEVSLTLHPGDLFGFVGHNGAGKTTLLKAIAGIHQLDEGTITLNGLSITKDPIAFKKLLAYIPDHPDLYESLTGQQFIHFLCDVYQVPVELRQSKIDQLATRFDMSEKLGLSIQTYSHGMKQKIALIGALIHEPTLLMLDEPFVGLDPKASFTLKEIFKELTEKGTIIFFSSHALEVVEKITNRLAIIKQGKIIATGETKTILKDKNLETLFLEKLD